MALPPPLKAWVRVKGSTHERERKRHPAFRVTKVVISAPRLADEKALRAQP